MSQAAPRIVDLADRPDLLDVVARWVHDEWGAQRGRTYSTTRSRFIEPSGRTGLPVSRVALIGGRPAGLASLRERDSIDYLPGATPWVCNVYVASAFRGSGIASALCRSLASAACGLGLNRLFLATSLHEGSLYHKLGYRLVSRCEEAGEPVHVLRKDLSA